MSGRKARETWSASSVSELQLATHLARSYSCTALTAELQQHPRELHTVLQRVSVLVCMPLDSSDPSRPSQATTRSS